MTEPLTMRAFHADDRTRDWRVVGDGATAVFRTGSFAVGARLVQAIAAAAGDAGPHHLDAGLQHDTVTVRLLTATPGYTGMTTSDAELAARISDLAREQGLAADPALIQTVQVTIDALVSADVMPFWAAVLGYQRRADSPDEDLVDPRWRGPSIWFQHMDAPRPQRNRVHTSTSGCRRSWPGRASPRPSRLAGGWSATRRPRGGRSPTPRATRSTSPRRPGATDRRRPCGVRATAGAAGPAGGGRGCWRRVPRWQDGFTACLAWSVPACSLHKAVPVRPLRFHDGWITRRGARSSAGGAP